MNTLNALTAFVHVRLSPREPHVNEFTEGYRMHIPQTLRVRSLLMLVLLLFVTPTSACAQEKPKRMIQGASVKELVPESASRNEDGISQIIFAQLFKPGSTEYTRVGASGLKGAPPLPTGYVLFKDLVYNVKTEAIESGFNITVFDVPSAENEKDFKNLAILHLEDDEMSPSGQSWNEVTLFPETADERVFLFFSKAKYDSLQPDFKSKRLAGVTDDFGTFAIALAPEFQAASTGPFTQMEVLPSSSPEPVRVGDEVTHTIVIKNKGPKAVAEVNVKEELGNDLDYISATPNQGICKQSTKSSGRVLCHLGALPSGASASITVVARFRDNPLTKDGTKLGNIIEVVFKENPTDFVVADSQILTQFSTTIIKEQ